MRASSATASTTDPTNALGLERDVWQESEAREPVGVTLPTDDDYSPPPPELIEWTPERAGSVVRAGGYLLHKADALHTEPGGEELWRATAADVDAIAPPLSRILNRYEPARRLAGLSDEGELAFALIAYTRENMALRGRLAQQRRDRDEPIADGAQAWAREAAGDGWDGSFGG